MTDSDKINLADPDSLLGMLQRGRGKGYLAALEAAPEMVWPLLFECVTNDPRVDQLCESREEYYASLIAATRMDLEPFRSYLVENDADDTSGWRTTLTLSTLSRLAVGKKSAAALQILRKYVSYGGDAVCILQTLAEVDPPAALEQTVAVFCRRVHQNADILARFTNDVEENWTAYSCLNEEARAQCRFLLPICEPWKMVCTRNRELADLFAGVGIAYDQPVPPPEKPSAEYLAGLSLTDLFSQADGSNYISFLRVLPGRVSTADEDHLLQQLATGNRYRMILALRGLGQLGTARAFAAVKSWIETSENAEGGVRRHAFRAFTEMPGALTPETARQWFRREEWYLQVAAGEVLKHHAMPEDVPLLIEALRTPATIHGADSRLSGTLNALARFDGIGSFPEVERIFRETRGCYRRYDAAHALAVTAPVEFTSEYAFECLWDCHWCTRILGCEMVSLAAPGALERLREVAADTGEEDDVRQAARERLEGF